MNVYVLVEYEEQGNEAGIVPIAVGTDVTELQVVGAHDYRAEHAKLADYREQHVNDLAQSATLMSRAQFLSQSSRAPDWAPR